MNLSLEARKVKDLDAATRDWIVDLMERNLKEVIDMVSPCSEQMDHSIDGRSSDLSFSIKIFLQ